MITQKRTAWLALAGLFMAPVFYTAANPGAAQPRLIPLTDFFRNPETASYTISPDGGQWLIGQGIADPKRIGIHGASYGGYATLAGLTFTPDLYACGIDYVGVSNLFTLLETLPPDWELGRRMM